MSSEERKNTIFPEPVPEPEPEVKSKYYDKAKLNEFANSVEKHKEMFNKLLKQKQQKAIEIIDNFNKTTPDSVVINPRDLFSPDQKRTNLLNNYEKIRNEPITSYDKNFFQKFKNFDDKVKSFLESHNIKSLGDEGFSQQLANFFTDEFLTDYNDRKDLNKTESSASYDKGYQVGPTNRFYSNKMGEPNSIDSSPFFSLIQRLNTQFYRANKEQNAERANKEQKGGKRRRSTKRNKTKRSKRKQKRNTKRRASHRRRR